MKDIKIEIPKSVGNILSALTQAGYEAYVVGGCVRDSLLGRKPADWDVTTNALPAQVRAVCGRTLPTGIKHGTVTVLVTDGAGRGKYRSRRASYTGVEVTTYRVDGVYEDARHPKEVTFTPSLEEDLKRRDFTINAMAYNEETGLVDLFDGQGDLDRKLVRCVGDPYARFTEDALRILRAFRFSAQLGFDTEAETEKAASTLAQNLTKISAERIRDELVKLIVSDHPERITDLYRAGATAYFLKEFDVCMETAQNNPYHTETVGGHTTDAMRHIRPDKVLRLTMLLHDIAKPLVKRTDENGCDHFYGHEKESAVMAREIMRRLKFDNKTTDTVCNLIRYHDLQVNAVHEKPWVRKMMHRTGRDAFPLLLEVMEADNAAKAPEKQERLSAGIAGLRALYEEITASGDAIDLKDLAVSGADLIANGVPEGKAVGEALEALLQDVLKNPAYNTTEYLLSEARLKRFTGTGKKKHDTDGTEKQ